MDAVALRLTGGHKAYQRSGARHVVFTDLDLEVRAGEIVALLGPSGCGKSTLLRALARLEPLDGGEVQVTLADDGAADGSGLPGRGSHAAADAVGIAFQEPSLLPWLTVAENVAIGLQFAANRRARRAGSVERALAELGLATLAGAYPAQLSGGQAQRTNVARLVVAGRPILLLDEPFAALDPSTRTALQDWLLELRAARGLSMLLVTHDVSEAVHLGDRVVLMAGTPGRIRRVWDVRGLSGRASDHAGTRELRAEILREYDPEPDRAGDGADAPRPPVAAVH